MIVARLAALFAVGDLNWPPLVTVKTEPLVGLYCNQWAAPTSLWEMISKKVPKKYVEKLDNYNIRLIQPAKLTDEDLKKFKTDFGLMMDFIKLSDDKKEMMERFGTRKGERFIRNTGVQLLNACTGSNLKYDENEEVVDMCDAIQGIREDGIAIGRAEGIEKGRAEGIAEGRAKGKEEGIAEGRAKGKEEGIAEGRAKGKEEGIAEGRARGIEEGKLVMLYVLTENGSLTIGEAAKAAEQTEEEFRVGMEGWKKKQAAE